MKNALLIGSFAFIFFSCSATLQKRYDQRHGVYSDDDYRTSGRYNRRDDGYRRDYDKVPADRSTGSYSSSYAGTDRMLAQYDEMDKLGEDVMYEIDLLDKRFNVLLDEYKTANKSSRNVISEQLDRISDDQLTLYRAYTRIYRNGKNNWPAVKSEVETTIRSVKRSADR